jgi:hypothetical protein
VRARGDSKGEVPRKVASLSSNSGRTAHPKAAEGQTENDSDQPLL